MEGFKSLQEITKLMQEKLKKIGYEQKTIKRTRQERLQEKVNYFNEKEGSLNTIYNYNCKLCKNRGYINKINNQQDDILVVECECMKIRQVLLKAKRSGLGDIITDYTFDKYDATEEWQKNAKQKAIEFCNDNDAKWFYIGGQVGSGKTMLCTAICAYYIKQAKDVKYMLWHEETKILKSLLNTPEYHTTINQYNDAEVLYIDDFLKVKQGEAPTAADINIAFEIINHRTLSKDKITIISSEKILDDLFGYDEATISRIYQKTKKYRVSINYDKNKNYRLIEKE